MSFSSARYLADRERLLEPDSVIITGNRKRHAEIKREYVITEPVPRMDEAADNEAQDEYIKWKQLKTSI